VVKDKSLSTYAHNVKIITQNGEVTLKGTVRTELEKSAVEDKAAAVVGKEHVTNQIEVAASKP
jgi:hyperosmotically inducible protein